MCSTWNNKIIEENTGTKHMDPGLRKDLGPLWTWLQRQGKQKQK